MKERARILNKYKSVKQNTKIQDDFIEARKLLSLVSQITFF